MVGIVCKLELRNIWYCGKETKITFDLQKTLLQKTLLFTYDGNIIFNVLALIFRKIQSNMHIIKPYYICQSECSTPGRVLQEQSKGAESPPSNCWPLLFRSSPRCSWPSGLQGHSVGLCPAFYLWELPNPSLQSYSQWVHLSSPGAAPCIWTCWTPWSSHGPSSQFSALLSFMSSADLLRIHLISLSHWSRY